MSFFRASQRGVLNQSPAEVQGQISVSLEFFPPRTSEMEQTLWNSIDRLSSLKPKFVSVTYGVDSGKRDHIYSIIRSIKDHTGPEAAPHLIYIDATPAELWIIAHGYWSNGTRHIVALRGDLPSGGSKPEIYASDLMTLLEEVADFDISVAAYPEVRLGTKSTQVGLLSLRRKVDARANRAVTQFFFDVESYLRFHDRCVSAGIDAETIPGILPVSSFKQAKKFAGMTSVRIPAWMIRTFDGLDDNVGTHKLAGVNIAMDMIKILSHEGVKDLHFHMFSRAEMNYAIYRTLDARPGS